MRNEFSETLKNQRQKYSSPLTPVFIDEVFQESGGPWIEAEITAKISVLGKMCRESEKCDEKPSENAHIVIKIK